MNTPSSNDFRTTKAVLLGRLRSHDVDFTVRFRTLTKLLYDVIVTASVPRRPRTLFPGEYCPPRTWSLAVLTQGKKPET